MPPIRAVITPLEARVRGLKCAQLEDDNKALDQLTSKEACKDKPRSDEIESGMPGCLWSFSFVIPIGAYSPVSCHYQDFHMCLRKLYWLVELQQMLLYNTLKDKLVSAACYTKAEAQLKIQVFPDIAGVVPFARLIFRRF
ncbi:uncharacterized protein LOC142177955 isoform X3 [Nicotiana tabacum]|uniref:Uncharacterized protein LOC142177955 isoform X3 n=1 Tax=Nicotiana tabacum TaxID=4097 RepID=A0AC58U100_TOBAC